MQKPGGNRGHTQQNACVSRQEHSPKGRAQDQQKCDDLKKLVEVAGEDLLCVKLERNQTGNSTAAKKKHNPRTNGHWRLMLKDAQHVQKQMWATEIHDEQDRGENRADRCEPHGCQREIALMKDYSDQCDDRSHPGKSAHEKVKRNFPCPYGRFNDRLAVVTGPAWDWSAGDVHATAFDGSFLPSLLAQLIETLFVRHTSVAASAARGGSVCENVLRGREQRPR